MHKQLLTYWSLAVPFFFLTIWRHLFLIFIKTCCYQCIHLSWNFLLLFVFCFVLYLQRSIQTWSRIREFFKSSFPWNSIIGTFLNRCQLTKFDRIVSFNHFYKESITLNNSSTIKFCWNKSTLDSITKVHSKGGQGICDPY